VYEEEIAFNPEQSSAFGSRFGYQQAGLTYRLTRGKLNASVGAEAQFSTLTGSFGAAAEGIRRNFRNVLPNVSLNQQLDRSTRVSFVYNTNIREPAINQLQPVISRIDPLNQYLGNPGLRPEYIHQGRLSFHTLRRKSGLLLTGSLSFDYATNPITAAVTIDELQVRTTQYVNVKRRRSASVFLNLSLPVKKLNGRFNLSPYWQETQGVNLLNGEAGTVNQRAAGGHAGYMYRYKQYFDLSLRTNVAFTTSSYALNTARNQVLFNTGYTGEATVHFLKRFNATAELYYTKFVYKQASFDQAIPICNFYISAFLLKGNRGEARISAFNVLNRNVGVAQTANPNYVEQTTQNALGSFYLLSFTYNINKPQ
jgi:outer membrane receptor protein involved in Fe transport